MRKQSGLILSVMTLFLVIIGVLLELLIVRMITVASELQAENTVKSAYTIAITSKHRFPKLFELVSYIQGNEVDYYTSLDKKSVQLKTISGVKVLMNRKFYLVYTYRDPDCKKPTRRVSDMVRCIGTVRSL